MNFMRCLGLSDPTILDMWNDWWKKATRVRRYQLGNFDVEEYDDNQGGVSMLTCCCGRSDAVFLTLQDAAKVSPVTGLCACEICLDELDSVTHPRDQVEAWISQNRSRIKVDECLELPVPMTRLKAEGISERVPRFVYQVFSVCKLDAKDKVRCTCGNSRCVNPHHMLVVRSNAAKLTPEIKAAWATWLQANVSHKAILDLTSQKFNVSLSLKTLGNYKKQLVRSAHTQSC